MDEEKLILEKLEKIQAGLDRISARISDVDIVLTDDDEKSLREPEKDFHKGKTVKL